MRKQIEQLRDLQDVCGWFELPEEDEDGIDVSRFLIVLRGPDQYDPDPRLGDTPRPSPYAGGFFTVEITTPSCFPARGSDKAPPDISFNSAIYHPLVSAEGSTKGKICAEIVKELWMDAWEAPHGEPLSLDGVGAVHPSSDAPSGEGHLWTTILMLRKFLVAPQWEYFRGINAEAKGLIREFKEGESRKLNMDAFDAKARELVQRQ